jgi:meiotic recombination protein SPO11
LVCFYLLYVQAFSVPVSIEAIKDVVSVAHYILVVEKETVFQRLANDKFCERNRCIVITGRGYPDIPTRRFLRYLVEQLHLPAYCLVDSDPYGFDILATYKFGSLQLAYDANLLRVPDIRWLGVFTSDLEDFCFPDCCLLHLSPEDRRKAEGILARCYLHKEAPEWRSELEAMLQKGVKFEIEALSASSISFLSDRYIPQKIKQGRHL